MSLEQRTWYEGYRKTPLWLRALGVPRTHYRDGGKTQAYRACWGEFTFGRSNIAFDVGGYETAHLHVAFVGFSAFIRLPFLDDALCDGPNGMESRRFGFTTFNGGIHLHWGRACKILYPLWQPWWGIREYLDHAGEWRPRLLGEGPGAEAPRLTVDAPYHYMLDSGEVQHVTATLSRSRTWPTWQWFGTSGRLKRAPVSDFLRRLQVRFCEPKQYIEIEFSGEVGARAGSWKGGCVACSYEMRPGETPVDALRRMQRERRFR